MNNREISGLSIAELVDEFIDSAKRRGAAVLDLDSQRANVQFDRMKKIDTELRNRGRNARLELAPLLKHPDRFVRFYAAQSLLGLLPEESRAVIEWNAEYEVDSLSADARACLHYLDIGFYKPD